MRRHNVPQISDVQTNCVNCWFVVPRFLPCHTSYLHIHFHQKTKKKTQDGSGIYASDSQGQVIPYLDPPKGADVKSFRDPNLRRRAAEVAEMASALRGGAARKEGTPLGEVGMTRREVFG